MSGVGRWNRHRFGALLRWDIAQALREPIYAAIFFGVLLIAALGRFGIPAVAELLEPIVSIRPQLPFIFAAMLLLPSLLIGMVTGFVLLDERDGGLLSYFEVTPLGRGGYIGYRLAVPFLVSAPVTFALALLLPLPAGGFPALEPASTALGMFGLYSVAAAAQGPLVVLFLGSFAQNKVEGLAYSKAFGLVIAAPIAAHFIPSDWALLLGVVPTVWITEGLLSAHLPRVLLYGVLAIALFCVLIFLLYRRFLRRPHASE